MRCEADGVVLGDCTTESTHCYYLEDDRTGLRVAFDEVVLSSGSLADNGRATLYADGRGNVTVDVQQLPNPIKETIYAIDVGML